SGWKDSTLYDIVVAAIGAFFGYGFALVVEHQLLARKRRKCITNIALELKDLKTRLERSANDPAIPSALSYSIHTPIWETVVGNGDILELKTKKLRDCYDVLFRVYSSIEKLSVLENSTREKDGAAIINEVLGMRRAVLKLFDEDPLKSLIDDCE
ncbi:MAG: hypothetical protein FWH55_08035, partial [Oscillospiraceae bacterium]|nr:hypothetical protein [Oscillospiraceae bacterium]